MSNSRLEKFIYAICSMEVSDLPAPLSRIEILWNCLITGETPDFEPQSHNEKYLMAMLGLYELENLPTPISRGEKLLYKIAMGETDLSDVPGYLSRYEELLKYLIENGGISGGDFEYVLHTLNQSLSTLYTTAEKPVKSAILKGNTLVNLVNCKGFFDGREINSDNTFKIDDTKPFQELIIGKEYTFIGYVSQTAFGNMSIIGIDFNEKDTGTKMPLFAITDPINGVNKVKFTVPSNYGSYRQSFIKTSSIGGSVTVKGMIIEGDLTQQDIPYFTGMQSVKMPVLTVYDGNITNIPLSFFESGNYNYNGWTNFNINCSNVKITVKLNNFLGTDYSLRMLLNNTKTIDLKSFEEKTISLNTLTNIGFHTGLSLANGNIGNLLDYLTTGALKLKIEINGYPPYPNYDGSTKTNILTVNEEVELRGTGDVQDTLDCLTGEVTERICEIVLDGSETWVKNSYTTGYTMFRYVVPNLPTSTSIRIGRMLCDKFNVENYINAQAQTREFITIRNGATGQLLLNVSNEKANEVTVLKEWLSQNPTTVQYELATPTIKTVDLTTVDQDGQPTELGTFENVTHVSLESDGLIPEVAMEVATRISTELASASPLMDDISTKQEQLNTTVDEQSNNVDATMIATTEIYEETL